MGPLKEGDRAPDFSLLSQDARMVSLHEYAGSKNVVLYFYPKDFTPGCTAEAIAFSANYAAVKELDAEVIGVSSDTAESHHGFAQRCDVGYPLLSDEGGRVRAAYGVKSSLGLVPGRVTFVIDKGMVVRKVFSSQIHPRRHIAEALEALKALRS